MASCVSVVQVFSADQLVRNNDDDDVEALLARLTCVDRADFTAAASSIVVPSGGLVWLIFLSRPEARNAVNRALAEQLSEALLAFDASSEARVAIVVGEGGNFCAGADLKAVASPSEALELRHPAVEPGSRGPIGPTRMQLSKPLLAAVDGYAVAGGLELALLADMRLCTRRAVFGVFCRRFGVPLIDGGTVRLPRIVGLGRALDMILTGRAVSADEALSFGLVSRVVEQPDRLLPDALLVALQLCRFPQATMLADRQSVYHALDVPFQRALEFEFNSLDKTAQHIADGARRFASGQGRAGQQIPARL